jgi:hypothetical protein
MTVDGKARHMDLNEADSSRPFTSPALYGRDLGALHWMLASLRWTLMEAEVGNSLLQEFESLEWVEDGLRRRHVVCDAQRLRIEHDAWVVGFLGVRLPGIDFSPMEEANAEIVREFRDYPGILSYSSMEFPDGNWANLVLHDPPEAREQWRSSHRHAAAAAELSPRHYASVRIHNGFLPGGPAGLDSIRLLFSKYWDYTSNPVWRADRDLGPDGWPPRLTKSA